MSADWIEGFATGVFVCLFVAAALGTGAIMVRIRRDNEEERRG